MYQDRVVRSMYQDRQVRGHVPRQSSEKHVPRQTSERPCICVLRVQCVYFLLLILFYKTNTLEDEFHIFQENKQIHHTTTHSKTERK
jgi:hypothetical protein